MATNEPSELETLVRRMRKKQNLWQRCKTEQHQRRMMHAEIDVDLLLDKLQQDREHQTNPPAKGQP